MPRAVIALLAAWAMLNLQGCRAKSNSTESPDQASANRPTDSPFAVAVPDNPTTTTAATSHTIALTEVAAALGLDHHYINGAAGQVMIVETIGGGVGWLDLDNDGYWDLVANQGGQPTSTRWSDQPVDQLYQNLSGQQFRKVTEAARFQDPYYGQAVAVGDFDNDGLDDIYLSNLTTNTLWQNLGDGTLHEVGRTCGVDDPRWSASAAWSDLDNDGDLDLYVCNYCVYDPLQPKACQDPQGRTAMCNPGTLEPWPDACYINQGNGVFLEQAVQRGLFGKNNRALGVAIADFTGDHLPDIYVANDTTENFLFVNLGEGRFEERAALLGCAVDREGGLQASMGVAVGDFDFNGWPDVYVTNYYEESNTLYANYGPQGFQDVTAIERLHQPTLPLLGFGTVMEDFDHNGHMELITANGHVNNASSNPVQEMPPQLFTRTGKLWRDISREVGAGFTQPRYGRGLATADYDRDGDLDLAVLNQNGPLTLLRNDSRCGACLSLLLHGRVSNRRGIGAQATVRYGQMTRTQQLYGGTSYASSMQPLLRLPLGQLDPTAELSIELRWPSGQVQQLKPVPINQVIEVWEPLGAR